MEAEDKLLIRRAEEAAETAGRQCRLKMSGFLDPREAAVIKREVRPPYGVEVEFFGGYTGAERVMFICRPDYIPPDHEAAVSVIEVTGRAVGGLSHRDFLGSLMALGIKRENIGDILPLSDRCYIFVRPSMCGYITENLTKIGSAGVRLAVRNLSDIVIPERETVCISATVSSLRLDCVLSAAVNAPRARAAEMIRGERVKVDFEIEKSVSRSLKGGELISVRGYGRYRLSEVRGLTRKGRISVIIDKYV